MKKRSGFTLIEIAIFLAVTGLLFVGIAVGTGNSVSQQRFTDSVKNFADFLRNVYSEVSNPQSKGDGRGNKAIYGRMITFGENYALNGELNEDDKIFVYDVIGEANSEFSGSTFAALKSVGASPVIEDGDSIKQAGLVESYSPKWGAKVEIYRYNNNNPTEESNATVIIARHPRTGLVYTLLSYSDKIQVNEAVVKAKSGQDYKDLLLSDKLEGDKLVVDRFQVEPIDFCVSSDDNYNRRQDIRIVSNARNASGVKIIPLDDPDNKCSSDK